MCSSIAEKVVQDVVEEFIAKTLQFTAKDITDEVKVRLKADNQPFERHNDLKGSVHKTCDALMDAQWEQTAICLPGISANPFLYHRTGTDPQDYIKAFSARGSLPGLKSSSIVNTPAGILSAFGPVSSARVRTVVDPGRRSVVDGGRLIVARKFLQALGYVRGDVAHVCVGNNALRIPEKGGVFSSPHITIKVDDQGRIRLNKKSRQSLGVDGLTFKITQTGQSLEVQPI